MSRCPVKLSYDLIEPKSGCNDHLSPLIFLHPISLCKEEGWKGIPQAIADLTKRKAYVLDARNHGDSDWSDEFDFDLNVIDLLHFIDKKKLSKVVIIGHCMGGITGIKAAVRAPEKIEMLFVEDVFINKLNEDLNKTLHSYTNLCKEVEKLIPLDVDKHQADSFITQYIFRKTRTAVDPEKKIEVGPDVSYSLRKNSDGRYIFKANLDVINKEDCNAMLGVTEGIYAGPAFFFIAKQSAFKLIQEKHNILMMFPKAVFIEFESANHFLHEKYPDQFVAAITKHLTTHEKNQ